MNTSLNSGGVIYNICRRIYVRNKFNRTEKENFHISRPAPTHAYIYIYIREGQHDMDEADPFWYKRVRTIV